MVVYPRKICYVSGVSPFLLGALCVPFLKRTWSICSCIVLLLESFDVLLATFLKSILLGSLYLLLFEMLSYFDSHPKFNAYGGLGFQLSTWKIWMMINAAIFKWSSVDFTTAFREVLKAIQEVASFGHGSKQNSVSELLFLLRLRV